VLLFFRKFVFEIYFMSKTVKQSKVDLKPSQLVPSRKRTFKSISKETETLVKAGKRSAALAIRESKALGLSITYLEKGVLYQEHADGTKEVVAQTNTNNTTEKTAFKNSTIKLKKGMILHAKN